MKKKKVTLYVKSVKTVIGAEKIDGHYFHAVLTPELQRIRLIPKHEVDTITKYSFILPKDQNRTVKMAKEIAAKHGFKLEVVDVTKENMLHRVLQEEVKRIKTFPTLITDSGEKIEGDIAEEQIESLLSKSN